MSDARSMTAIFAAAFVASAVLATTAWADPPPQPPEAAPAPVAASHDGETSIAEVKALCIAARGDAAATMAKADAAGWSPAPAEMLKAMDSPALREPQGRVLSEAGGDRYLVTGVGELMVGSEHMRMDMCMVMKKQGDAQDIVAAVTRWMGPKFAERAESRVWIYSPSGGPGGSPTDVSDSQAVAAAKAGGIEMIQVQTSGDPAGNLAYVFISQRTPA